MADITSIQPQAAAAAPQEEPQPPMEPNINMLAPEVANLPVVQAVFTGQPAAVYATTADKDNPSVGLLAQAQQDLPAAGLGLFATDDLAVLFNPNFTSPQEIAEAARAGNIDSVAVPLAMLDEAFAQAQGEMDGAAPTAAPEAAGGSPVPAAGQTTQSRINAARAQNLKPSAPTKGAKPGQGIINDLTRKAF
jgi:hypothetical protein